MSADKPFDIRERTFLFARDVVVFCREFSKEPGACRQIAAQLIDAGTSVGANTEEAKAAYSRREFACKNSLVLKECRESLFWLRLIVAADLVPEPRVRPLIEESNELIRIFTTTVKRARRPLTNL